MGNSADIPIIDISGDEVDVARQLVNAAEEHGFIYIKNLALNITPDAIDEAFQLVREQLSTQETWCSHHHSNIAIVCQDL